jgi:hypothetical protein
VLGNLRPVKPTRLIAVCVSAVFALSGCAAGLNAETQKPYAPTDGNQADSGDVKVRNLLVVDRGDGVGEIIGTVINSGSEVDSLESIEIDGELATLSAGSFALAENRPIIFGGPSSTATATVPLRAKAGTLVRALVTFEKAGEVELTLIIREAALEYESQKE